MKACTKCGVVKALEDFPRNANRTDGHQSRCKACCQEHITAYRSTPKGRESARKTTRARGRALEALARRHPEEFGELLSAERQVEGLPADPVRPSATQPRRR